MILALLAGRLRGGQLPPLIITMILSFGILLAAASGLLAVWAVFPRTKLLGANSMIHYGKIAAFSSAREYHVAAIELVADHDRLTAEISDHIWTISRSAGRKYFLVARSIKVLVGSLVVGIVAMLTWRIGVTFGN